MDSVDKNQYNRLEIVNGHDVVGDIYTDRMIGKFQLIAPTKSILPLAMSY